VARAALTVDPVNAQGWYQDPFRLHEQRWFSDGRPTSLVRDGSAEADDAPPSAEYQGPLIEAATAEAADGGDLLRADEQLRRPDYVRAAVDTAVQAGWNFN
jgi:hypothetical protein